MVTKSGGTASVWGFDIDEHPRNAKRAIGVVPQEIIFDPFFTPRESLEIQAGLYGVPKARPADDGAAPRDAAGGQGRRLCAHLVRRHEAPAAGRQGDGPFSPPILVLDEPTAGVDVELRQQLWDYVRSLNAQGVTIVLTTHYLEEAEQLCDRIAIINHGKVIANEPTRALVNMAQEKIVEVTVDRDLAAAPAASCFDKIEFDGERTLTITYRKDRVNAGQVLDALQSEGLGIVEVSTREPDLEDVFLNLTRAAADG